MAPEAREKYYNVNVQNLSLLLCSLLAPFSKILRQRISTDASLEIQLLGAPEN